MSGAAPTTQMDLRLFRLFLAVLVGVALAGSGVALQALLRNPLAEPFILGLSTGAAAGVMLLEWLNRTGERLVAAQHVGAVLGAVLSMLVVYAASRRNGVIDPLGLLLVGVVVSTINGALVVFLHYIMAQTASPTISRWIMGYLHEELGAGSVWMAATTIGAGFALLLYAGRSMDVATFSDDEAQSLGVNLALLRKLLFLAASALAAAAVLLAGPLAFVGFVCPHLGRLMFGPGHRVLLGASALLAAALLLLADTAIVYVDVRWNMGQLPLGIFTAVVGGVLFISILRTRSYV